MILGGRVADLRDRFATGGRKNEFAQSNWVGLASRVRPQRFSRIFVGLVLIAWMLAACGARTGLTVLDMDAGPDAGDATITIDGMQPLPDWRVSGTVRCGNCYPEKWCFSNGIALCTTVNNGLKPPGLTCEQYCASRADAQWIGAGQPAVDAFGNVRDLYCAGPAGANINAPNVCIQPSVLGFTPWPIDGCFLTDEQIRTWLGIPAGEPINRRASFSRNGLMPGTTLNRATVCPHTTALDRSCNYDPTQPRLNLFNDLRCPKAEPHPLCLQEYIVRANSQTAAEEAGRRLLGRYANMFGTARMVGETFGSSTPGSGFYINGGPAPVTCFLHQQSVNVRPNTGIAVPNNDPGIARNGFEATVLSTTRLVVEDGTSSPPVMPLSGEAFVDISNGRFTMTLLELQQPAGNTVVASGYTVTNSRLLLENFWRGAYTVGGAAPNIAIELPSTVSQVQTTVDGSPRIARPMAETATGHFDGSSLLDLTLRFRPDDSIPTWLRLELHLQIVPRPTATITSAPTTVECKLQADGFVGALVPVAGTTSVAGATMYWSVESGNGVDWRSGASATLRAQVPPTSSSPQPRIGLYVPSGRLAASVVRNINVVDGDPPTITGTTVTPSCGWGHSAAEGNPQVPAICARITGNFSDVCTQPRSSIVRVYDYPSNALLEERELQDGDCITPSPVRMNSNMVNADYEVEWRAVDGWGNWTSQRHWRGWFAPSSPSGSCSYGTTVNTIWDY